MGAEPAYGPPNERTCAVLLLGHRMTSERDELIWHRVLSEGRDGVAASCGLTPNPSWRVAVIFAAGDRMNCPRCLANLERQGRDQDGGALR